jgi:hypothetical protein
MGGKAYTLSNSLLNHIFRTTAYTQPGTLYVGLFSTVPTTGNLGTELTIGQYGYARVGVGTADADWNYTAATFIAASTVKNAAAITFAAVTSVAWTVNGFGIWDASTAGNLLYWGSVTGAPVTVSVGATASFAIDQLTITEN